MPQETLGRDLKQQVLEQIQKKPSATLSQHDAHPGTLPETSSGQRRGLIWAGLAIAAALTLMFLANPDREQHDPVAAADEKANAEKGNSKKQSVDVGRKGDAARNELAIDQEREEAPVARESGEEFGLAETPETIADLPAGELADEVARSSELPAEGMTVAPRDGVVESRRFLETPESDRLASQPSSSTASVREDLAKSSPQPTASDAKGVGMSDRRDRLEVADSQTYEIAYEGTPEEALRQFSQVLNQQGVVLRKTSLEERERLELDLLLSEKQSQVELNSWEKAASERKSPGLSKSGRATASRAAEESLLELPDEAKGETGETQAAGESEPATQEAVLVEATPEQVDRVLAAWQVLEAWDRKQSGSRIRSNGTQRFRDSSGGEYGVGEFGSGEYGGAVGGGGGGYGGRSTQTEGEEAVDKQTSWAMRFSVKSLPEPDRDQSSATPAKAKANTEVKQKSEEKDRRVRVLFYFRPAEAK